MKKNIYLFLSVSLFLLAYGENASAISVIAKGLGLGAGTITGKNNGTGATVINCFYGGGTTQTTHAGTCSANLPSGTSLTFTVAPSSGSHFAHWNNNTGSASPCSAGTVGCTFTLTQDTILNAKLVKPVVVTATKSGTGIIEGLRAGFPATSQNIKIQCGNICTFNAFTDAFTLVFTATAGPGHTFVGWQNCTGSATICNGTTTPCQVPIQATTNVNAVFRRQINP